MLDVFATYVWLKELIKNAPLFNIFADFVQYSWRIFYIDHVTNIITTIKKQPKKVKKLYNLGVKKVEAPSKCPEKWLIKWLSQKQKILSQSFLNSGTLVILCPFATMGPQFYSFLTIFLLFFDSCYICNMIYAENAPRILNKIHENRKEGGIFN